MEGPSVHGPSFVKVDVDRRIIEVVIAKGLFEDFSFLKLLEDREMEH